MDYAKKPRSSSLLLNLRQKPTLPTKYPLKVISNAENLLIIGILCSQNDIENLTPTISRNQESDSIMEVRLLPPNPIQPLTKEEYIKIARKKRSDFVHQHFGDALFPLFDKLRIDACKMKSCHVEATFTVPDHFDVDKTETMLREYFQDIGYGTISEPRKDDSTIIVLTLT